MSSTEAILKLQQLSVERANKVFALIEDLAELEILEDAADLKDARESLSAIKSDQDTVPYERLRQEAGLVP